MILMVYALSTFTCAGTYFANSHKIYSCIWNINVKYTFLLKNENIGSFILYWHKKKSRFKVNFRSTEKQKFCCISRLFSDLQSMISCRVRSRVRSIPWISDFWFCLGSRYSQLTQYINIGTRLHFLETIKLVQKF